MLTGAIIFLGLFLLSMILLIWFLSKDRTNEEETLMKRSLCLGVLVGGLSISTINLFFDYAVSKEPQAIDVYRGKTEIVVRGEMADSTFTPKDTLILFKEK